MYNIRINKYWGMKIIWRIIDYQEKGDIKTFK